MNKSIHNPVRKTKLIIFLTTSIILTGCAASGPKLKPVSEVHYSNKPTEIEAKQKIDAYMEETLIDPYSAKVKCSNVSNKAWIKTHLGFDKKIHYGYFVNCSVNAKNKFGGYTGSKTYTFLFNGYMFKKIFRVDDLGLM